MDFVFIKCIDETKAAYLIKDTLLLRWTICAAGYRYGTRDSCLSNYKICKMNTEDWTSVDNRLNYFKKIYKLV